MKKLGCNCWVRANKELAKSNRELVLSFGLKSGVTRVILETGRLDPVKSSKKQVLVAAFCPFCGKDYTK